MELPSTYNPGDVENKWYRTWESQNIFHADENESNTSYSIVIPPPNVTGNLHMGHALNNTLQDILIRWQRMAGKSSLWMPGMDHAGIATQNVVERLLKAEGKTKNDLGRESFVKRVWEWKEESGGQIQKQLKRLGCSLDWPRERFTLDDGLSRAVRKVFVSLYKEGLIYQGHRIINWCPRCETALSDIETEYNNLEGKLYYIKYPVVNSEEFITVATTRPETMLGDTGIAVNPDDERYSDLIGKKVILPLMNREIPVFPDSFVDRDFGTGLVKVTPAHDPNDFEMGKRHNLEEINILDERGFINEKGGKYNGLSRFDARAAVLKDLEEQGLLIKTEKHDHSVGHCYRCNTIIEPYLSNQWFVKIKPLADEAIKAVEDGRIKFVPGNWAKTYFEWMYNIRDWCISRQLWWGHRIPAFYCKSCNHITVAMEDPESCENCGSSDISQDEDVLDTWFSSALWPFSTMGWPENTVTLKKYYPTSVLVTGFDIIFFWVARMIMMGLKFMKDIPFHDVYIHALVRDENGQKMSKSKGNVVDPLIVMDKYGTDAFRFTLAAFAAQGRDIIFSEKRIAGYSAFCNKIWNAARFILINLGDEFKAEEIDTTKLEIFDKWILQKLNMTVGNINIALEEYRFNEAAHEIYDFIWHKFCDWYIELVKVRLYSKDAKLKESMETAKQVLFFVLKRALQLLHPFMPFITEEIWEKISGDSEDSIMVSKWPDVVERFNFIGEAFRADVITEIIYQIRNIRGENNIPPSQVADSAFFNVKDPHIKLLVEEEASSISMLAKVNNIKVDTGYTPDSFSASGIVSNTALNSQIYDDWAKRIGKTVDIPLTFESFSVHIPLKGIIDFDNERKRLEKEIVKITMEIDRISKKLTNKDFINKAPEAIIKKEQEKMQEFQDKLSKLKKSLSKLS